MDHSTIPKQADKSNIAFSTVVFAGEIHKFIALECDIPQLNDRFSDVFSLICPHRSGEAEFYILKVTLFVAAEKHVGVVREQLLLLKGAAVSAIEIVWQTLASENEVGISLWVTTGSAGSPDAEKEYASRVRQKSLTWGFHTSNNYPLKEVPIENLFQNFWHSSVDSLGKHDLHVRHILRTWLYVEDINEYVNGVDNYQRMNLVRKNIFEQLPIDNDELWEGYPSSTGIGQNAGVIGMGVLACSSNEGGNYRVVPIENDIQESAYYYPNNESEIPPLFSRATAIKNDHEAMIFVSGTASIIGSKSVHVGDVSRQTRQTLKNIFTLLQSKELEFGAEKLKDLSSIVSCVIYVKRKEDYPKVKFECERCLPAGAVKIYTIADVCRADLLVEIEAISVLNIN